MPAPKKPEGRRQAHNQDRYKVVALAPAAPDAPKPPSGLLKNTVALWDGFWASDIARAWTDADHDGIVRLICYRDEWSRLMAAYREERFVTGSTKQLKVNPALEMAVKLEGVMARLADGLGLSPLARMKLGIAFGQAHKSIEELKASADQDPNETEPDPRAALDIPASDR